MFDFAKKLLHRVVKFFSS